MQGRVDVPAAGAHDQTLQRSEAHGGVDAVAVLYGRHAGPVAEMQGDQVCCLQGPAQVPGRLPGHIGVGSAVKTVAANSVFFIQFIGQGVVKGTGRKGLVKHGVEDRHLGDPGKRLPQHLDAEQIGRVVEGGQWDEFPNGRDDFPGDQGRLLEPFTSMNHAVAYPEQVAFPGQDPVLDC